MCCSIQNVYECKYSIVSIFAWYIIKVIISLLLKAHVVIRFSFTWVKSYFCRLTHIEKLPVRDILRMCFRLSAKVQPHKMNANNTGVLIPGPSGGCLERMFLLDYGLDIHRSDSRNQAYTQRLRCIWFLKSN